MDQELTPGEIGRSLQRIEAAIGEVKGVVERTRDVVGEHETAIQVLKSNRAGALWLMGGLWSLLMVVAEWVLHRKW